MRRTLPVNPQHKQKNNMEKSIRQKIFFGLIVVFLVLAGWLFWGKFFKTNNSQLNNQPESAQTANLKHVYQALNGLEVTDPVLASRRPLAVVVENHPDARPQSGLSKADVVYETVAEGGITRFLAIYQTRQAQNIGPIRSARTYFADIANELGAVFAHVGGNSDVLEGLKQNHYPRLLNLDQFFHDQLFHRISERPMPHNVYSSVERLYSFIKDDKASGNYRDWLYTDIFAGSQGAERVWVNFSEPAYQVSYVYNPSKGDYERYLAGKPHVDAEGNIPIFVKNIIVQSVKTWAVKTDTPLSIAMDLSSGGPAYVFAQGQVAIGTWKQAADGRTRYYDSAGREIGLLRGVTWVELVPEEKLAELGWSKTNPAKP